MPASDPTPSAEEPRIDLNIRDTTIELRFFGLLGADDLNLFFEHIAPIVRQNDRHWYFFLDFTHAKPANIDAIRAGAAFSKGNHPYVVRTAAIGLGSALRRFLFNRMIQLAGRRNMRAFETKLEADAWLYDPSLPNTPP